MVKVYLHEFFHNVEYRNQVDVKDGVVIKFLANENLDSATIVIPFSEKREIKALEKVEIELYDTYNQLIKTYYYVVDTFNEEQCDYDNSLYTYTIMLVSPTVLLEKVQIPNRKFTPLNNRSTYWQCLQILPYIKELYPAIKFSDSFIETYSAIEGVEKNFTKPNAKECLNDLLRINNSIIIFKDFDTLDFMQIDKKHLPIDESKLFTNVDSQNANDYVSALKVSAQNCQSENINVFEETVGVRAFNESVVTTDNMCFKLQHPIDEVIEAWMVVHTNNSSYPLLRVKLINPFNNSSGNFIFNFLIEKKEYDTTKVSNNPSTKLDDLYLRRYHIYYERGKNEILGLNYDEKTFFGLGDSLQAIFMIASYYDRFYNESGTINLFEARDCSLVITYKSVESLQFIANKKGIGYSDTKAVMPDNQNDTTINLDEYGKAETSKANRLGNPYKIITATYDKFSDVPKLFDYIDNYILSDIELACYDDFFNFKGVLYKNYIDQDMFYGVNAKRRTYKIAMEGFVNREEVKQKNILLSATPKANPNNYETYYAVSFLCNYDPNYLYKSYHLGYCIGRSQIDKLMKSDYFYMTPYICSSGNGFVMNFKTYDNYSIGEKIGTSKNKVGRAQDFVKYVDDNGECNAMTVYLYTYYLGQNSNLAADIDKVNNLPMTLESQIDYRNKIGEETFNLGVKDQQETLDLTLQFNCTSDDNIVITSKYIQRLINNRDEFFVWYSLSDRYNENDVKTKINTIKLDSEMASLDMTDYNNLKNDNTKLFNNLKLKLSAEVSTLNWTSWCLADTNGNLILAVNRADKLPTELYFNTL